jgi:ubiquinone/menaquinone biosynthesis C-methylase UbiE
MTTGPEQKAAIRDTFNIVAEGYDNPSFRFFSISAEQMVACLELRGDEHVLDVATGTGHVAFQLAHRLSWGRVTAIDFSERMLAQARMKTEDWELRNIGFQEMDMRRLLFPDRHFDAATCAFAIFFVKDMEGQIRHISEKVKTGGKIILSFFNRGSFMPSMKLFHDRLERYGFERSVPPWESIGTEDKCLSLLRKAGLSDAKIVKKEIGYFLGNPDEWWDVLWNGGARRYIDGISPRDIEDFREEHLAEVWQHATDDGLWLDVKVLYAMGTK